MNFISYPINSTKMQSLW